MATALALSAGQIRILDSQVFPGRASRLFPDPHDWSTGTSANVLMVAAGVEAPPQTTCDYYPFLGTSLSPRRATTLRSVAAWPAFSRSAAVFFGFLASRFDLFCPLATAMSLYAHSTKNDITVAREPA